VVGVVVCIEESTAAELADGTASVGGRDDDPSLRVVALRVAGDDGEVGAATSWASMSRPLLRWRIV
jgi:hypothetical protein